MWLNHLPQWLNSSLIPVVIWLLQWAVKSYKWNTAMMFGGGKKRKTGRLHSVFLIIFLLTANGLILASRCAKKNFVWTEMAVLLKWCISETAARVSLCTNISSTKTSWEDFLWCSHYTLTNTRQRFTTLSKPRHHRLWQMMYNFSNKMTYLGSYFCIIWGEQHEGLRKVTAAVVVAVVAV